MQGNSNIKYTIITIQAKDRENISIRKLNYKQVNKGANQILAQSK